MSRRVLFLPGAGGDPAFWTPVAGRLPEAFEALRLGWPGLGNQPARDDVRGLDDLVRLTLDRMDAPVDLVATDWRPEYRRDFPSAAPWIFDARVDLTDRIPTVAAPTLLVWGDADPISPVAVGRHLGTLLPRAEVVGPGRGRRDSRRQPLDGAGSRGRRGAARAAAPRRRVRRLVRRRVPGR